MNDFYPIGGAAQSGHLVGGGIAVADLPGTFASRAADLRSPYSSQLLSDENRAVLVKYNEKRRAALSLLEKDPYYDFARNVAGLTQIRLTDGVLSPIGTTKYNALGQASSVPSVPAELLSGAVMGGAPFSPGGGAPVQIPPNPAVVGMNIATINMMGAQTVEQFHRYVADLIATATEFLRATAFYNEQTALEKPQVSGFIDFSPELQACTNATYDDLKTKMKAVGYSFDATIDSLIRNDATRTLFAAPVASRINTLRNGPASRATTSKFKLAEAKKDYHVQLGRLGSALASQRACGGIRRSVRAV